MSRILEVGEQIWRGDFDVRAGGATPRGETLEVDDRTFYVCAQGNVSALRTDDGLVLFDTGAPGPARSIHDAIRSWDAGRVHTIIYTHGHLDHVSGAPLYDQDARDEGWDPPRVIAHEAVSRRFERYGRTAGLNTVINQRQFGSLDFSWPTTYRYPDADYRDTCTLEIGGERFELHHALGETDDHTWTWVPGRKMLFCGDLFIWACPNAGNPQKVQRYPLEWAHALRQMAELGAEIMLPGHVVPMIGAARIREALSDTAELLESLCAQTLDLMNEGASLNDIIHSVRAPERLLAKPYLRPVYDEPEFIVRNIWRLYGGWHDGNPANLKPAREAELANEIATLAGGADRLVARARELATGGDLRLACHLVELAAAAAPGVAAVHEARAHVYAIRAERETSLMARGVFRAAVRESSTHT